jgi:general secretion pathway protein N
MTKWWPPLAAGLGIYALALLVTAPATLSDAGLRRASEGRFRLAEAQGTLWSGSGQIELRDAAGRTVLSKHLAWRLRPRELFRARLGYEVVLDRGPRPIPVTVSWSRIELANADINLPAEILSLGMPKLAPLELSGGVNLRISTLSIGRDATQGSATLEWRTAGSGLSPVWPLGDYELRWERQGQKVRAILSTLKGPLQLRGEGSWAAGSAPVFVGTAEVPPEFRQRLVPFLSLIALERGEGIFDLQLK